MVFSSSIFLFVFLPLILLCYYLLGRQFKNLFLLAASLVFYAWGEVFYVLIMLGSIGTNYIIGRLLARYSRPRQKKPILAAGIMLNLGLLAYYKYANFVVENINQLIALAGIETIDWSPVHLPLGISFFTFQAMSYLIDVYQGENKAQRNIVNVALYISLFPQLIAGPIVRYHDISKQIRERSLSLKLINSGAQRFIYGLAKKVLIANPLGLIADQVFAIDGTQLTPELAWLGLACYTLQIYFDFSGYSDMAIGLGRMLGFRFLENFNYPYISQSIREFWRRWHISLSSWFRDYLYIPLGGNRLGKLRTFFNLLLVFSLCGLWHGASWTFLLWGLFHGSFLVIERSSIGKILTNMPLIAKHVYTLLVVMAGWVFFRTETLTEAGDFFAALSGFSSGNEDIYYLEKYLDFKIMLVLIVGTVLATPAASSLNRLVLERIQGLTGSRMTVMATAYAGINLLALSSLIFLCLMSIAANAYSPFIYFRF
jgi:alginate O-acetyltransferase complex protein AlgI